MTFAKSSFFSSTTRVGKNMTSALLAKDGRGSKAAHNASNQNSCFVLIAGVIDN
jgi:hypothetical protein